MTGWKSRADKIADEARKHGLNAHLWNLGIAVEHENNSKDWLDEVIKLLHVRAPLKVVIGYNNQEQRFKRNEQSDVNKLSFAAKVMKDACEAMQYDISNSKEEFLVIIGNSKLDHEDDHIDYRGYLFCHDRFIEIL